MNTTHLGDGEVTSHDRLVYIGQVAVFYVPIQKLSSDDYALEGMTPEKLFENYLMDNYNAFSVRYSDTKGFWREHEKAHIFIDENARYEVSFSGRDRVEPFIDFLSDMCTLIEEEAIYLVMGYKSWLVLPRKDKNVVLRNLQKR